MTVDVVNDQTGEITEALDAGAARDLVNAIRVNLEDAADLIEQLWSGQGWIALGFGSWDALVAAEIRGCVPKLERSERRETVRKLASAGMSTRAIGSALGTSHTQAQRDLDATGTNVPVAPDAPSLPEKVTGLDGRERPRKAAAKPEPTAEQKAETARLQRDARIHAAVEAIFNHLRRLSDEGVAVDIQAVLALIQSAIEPKDPS